MTIEDIEKPVGSLRILVHLFRNEKATITTMLKDADLNQRTAYAALRKLMDKNLIEVEVSSGFPVRKYYLLASKGKSVANHLEKVDSLLG
ncbi:MAG: helix-turn-helix domain-containing protein [Methanobacteriota archaeon]